MRAIRLSIAVSALMLAFSAPAAAHHLFVNPPGEADTVENFVGRGELPPQARGTGLFPHPPSGNFQPAAHGTGLVTACTKEQSPVVTFIAPPLVDPTPDCFHGLMP